MTRILHKQRFNTFRRRLINIRPKQSFTRRNTNRSKVPMKTCKGRWIWDPPIGLQVVDLLIWRVRTIGKLSAFPKGPAVKAPYWNSINTSLRWSKWPKLKKTKCTKQTRAFLEIWHWRSITQSPRGACRTQEVSFCLIKKKSWKCSALTPFLLKVNSNAFSKSIRGARNRKTQFCLLRSTGKSTRWAALSKNRKKK